VKNTLAFWSIGDEEKKVLSHLHQLMYVKEDLILPQTNTFYDFIVTKVSAFLQPGTSVKARVHWRSLCAKTSVTAARNSRYCPCLG